MLYVNISILGTVLKVLKDIGISYILGRIQVRIIGIDSIYHIRHHMSGVTTSTPVQLYESYFLNIFI